MKLLSILFILVLPVSDLNGQENKAKNLTLHEAKEVGLKNNPIIKASLENISASKGRFWSEISPPQPEIAVSYEYTPLGKSLSNYNERIFGFSQSFQFPLSYILKGAKFSKEEEIAYYRSKQTEVIIMAQIKSAYYNALAKEEQLRIAEENLRITEDFFKKAEIRFNVGEGTHLERLTAKVQFAEAANYKEVARNVLRTAYAELNFTLGYGNTAGEEDFVLTDSLSFRESIFLFDDLFNISLSTNQQIKIAELRLSTSSIDKRLARSSLLPGFNFAYFKQARDGRKGFYGASFGISVPLWFMSDQRGQIQEAAADVKIREAELQSVKNEVYLTIKSAFTDYENNLKQVRFYLNDILPQAEEVYRAATASYGSGEITYIEYLQARQTLIGAKSNYINALFNYNRSIFILEETVGKSLLS